VRGPARVIIHNGSGNIYGYPLKKGLKIIVKKHKQYPIESDNNLEVEVIGGSIEVVNNPSNVGTKMWRNVVNEYLMEPGSGALIIGPVDSGKSSFSIYLANSYLLTHGTSKINIIDADPGQGDVGGPGFIGSIVTEKPILDLEEEKKCNYHFLGFLSPYNFEDYLEYGILHLLEKFKDDVNLTIINLHGWVTGYRAMKHIVRILKKTNLKSVFIFNKDLHDKLSSVLRKEIGDLKIFYVTRPNTLCRTREVRRIIRERKYQRHLYMGGSGLKYVSLSPGLCENGLIKISTNNFISPRIFLTMPIASYIEDAKLPIESVKWAYMLFNNDHITSIIVKTNIKGYCKIIRDEKNGRRVDVYIIGRGVGLLSGMMIGNNWYMSIWEDFDFSNYKLMFLCAKSLPDRGVSKLRIGIIILSNEGKEKGIIRVLPHISS